MALEGALGSSFALLSSRFRELVRTFQTPSEQVFSETHMQLVVQGHSLVSRAGVQYNRMSGHLKEEHTVDSRIRQLMKTLMRSSRNVDWRISRSGRLAIISLGCLAAAFLSGWSYYSLVFVVVALIFTVFAVYVWTHSRRRRSAGRPRR
jgi:hypothetical protein